MSKWTLEIAFVIVILTASAIIFLLYLFEGSLKPICPVGQANEIQKIVNKVNEIKGRPGYEVVYLEVKGECVEYIESGGKKLMVKYKTVNDPVEYPTEFDWNFEGKLNPGNYPLRVFADRVELMGESE